MRKIETETPISCSEVKETLEAIQKKEKELNFRAQKTMDYLESTSPLSAKKAQELYKKLEGLKVSRLREVHFTKLVDIMPTKEDDVKVVLSGYAGLTVKKDDLKKIAEACAGFAK